MQNYVILTDSCSDLSKDIREKYQIEYVQMHIRYEEKELPASLDWDYYTPQELYGLMKGGKRITTTQVPTATFLSVFEEHLQAGRDVLYIGCSSALSGSVNTGAVIANELQTKYPDNRIYCVDALNSCFAEGLMAIDASIMRSEGKPIDEVVRYLEMNRLCYLQFATVEDLTYLKRAGRVKASAAFFGNLFGVKPIIISNRAGENFAMKKVKGRKASLDEIYNLAKEAVTEPEKQIIGIMHADCPEDVEYLKAKIENELHPKEIYVNYLGPIIGSTTGPKTIAIYLKGKEVQL